jgi:hypothetical protein
MKRQYQGLDTTANVFTAELIAIKLAIGILGKENQPPSLNCSIYADGQAAIKTLDKPFSVTSMISTF